MIPLELKGTNSLEALYTIEFYTLFRGELIRKEEAEREWREADGMSPAPMGRTSAQEALWRLLETFRREGRIPRWVQFHPEIPPALVGNIASGRQVVIQLREHFDQRPPPPTETTFTRSASTPPPIFT